MVGESVAGLKTVERVLKEVQIFARLMAEGNGAHGDKVPAKSLQGVRVVCVHHMVAWSKTKTTTAAVRLALDSSVGLLLFHHLGVAIAMTMTILLQELAPSLIVLIQLKTRQQGSNSYLHKCWFLCR